jgi:hypothetical protein
MPIDRTLASEGIASKFTRVMKATPSRFGALADLPSASALSGVILVVALFALRHSAGVAARNVALVLAIVPLGASLLVSSLLGGSREKVVSWLASLPFAVDNVNALLAGTSDTIEVTFAEGARAPSRAELVPDLERISDDVLLVAEKPAERAVEIKLGIIDSKRWPLATNHRRYQRFVELVERVLVPLGERVPIAAVRFV